MEIRLVQWQWGCREINNGAFCREGAVELEGWHHADELNVASNSEGDLSDVEVLVEAVEWMVTPRLEMGVGEKVRVDSKSLLVTECVDTHL